MEQLFLNQGPHALARAEAAAETLAIFTYVFLSALLFVTVVKLYFSKLFYSKTLWEPTQIGKLARDPEVTPPTLTPAALRSKLKVLTYNTYLLFVNYLDGEFFSRFEEVCKKLEESGADVICLQEIYSVPFSLSYKLAKRMGKRGYYAVTPTGASTANLGAFIDSGVMILSKFKIEECIEEVFSDKSDVDCLSEKGVMHAKITLPSGEHVDIFNTHLQSMYLKCDLKKTKIKFRQTNQLIKFIQNYSTSEKVILCGDFNTARHERKEFCEVLQRAGFSNLYEGAFPTTIVVTYDKNDTMIDTEHDMRTKAKQYDKSLGVSYESETLDFIFTKGFQNNGFEINKFLTDKLRNFQMCSDHRAVFAHLDYIPRTRNSAFSF